MWLFYVADYVMKQESFVKLTVPMTASHSGTVVEECVSLIRRLLDVREWCFLVRSFIQTTVMQLCEGPFHQPLQALSFHERTQQNEAEKAWPSALGPLFSDGEVSVSSDCLFCAALAVIGGYDSRVRIGGMIRLLQSEDPNKSGGDRVGGPPQFGLAEGSTVGESRSSSEHTGVLCRISASGRIYVQDDFGVVKRCAFAGLEALPELSFNPRVLPESDETTQLWVRLISLAMGTIRLKDWSIPVTALQSSSVVYQDSVIGALLTRQQELLQILKSISVLTDFQQLLRKVLRQIWVEDKPPDISGDATLADGIERTPDHPAHLGRRSASRSLLLFERVLAKATQPSPVKAIFSRRELEEAALTICQHLSAINRKSQEKQREQELNKSLMKCVSTATTIGSVPSLEDQVKSPTPSDVGSVGSAPDQPSSVSFSGKNVGGKESTTGTRPRKKSTGSGATVPAAPVVQQLMEMGFHRDSVEAALKALVTEHQQTAAVPAVSPSPETLVAWLLEHHHTVEQQQQQNSINTPQRQSSLNTHSSTEAELSDSDSISEEFEDIDASGHDTCLQPEVFKKPADFSNNDEYARYVQEHISIGMTVRCCQTFDDLYEGDVGKVVKLDLDGLHDLNVQVDWQQKAGKHWVGYVHLEMIGYPLPVPQPVPAHMQNPTLHMASMVAAAGQSHHHSPQKLLLEQGLHQIRVGDRVRLAPIQSRMGHALVWAPKFSSADFGIVTTICGDQATVKFADNMKVTGPLKDLVLDVSTHPGVVCDGCFSSPIVGPRFKCKLCYSFDYCQQCFSEKKCHPHPFLRINEAGVPSIFAGKPGRAGKELTMAGGIGGTGGTGEGGASAGGGSTPKVGIPQAPLVVSGILKEWSKCVKQINVSSLESWAYRLIDGIPSTFWQSCGNQGKHWVMLEMQPNVLVQHLKMSVDPTDGSYMPSKVCISVGSSAANMKDLTHTIIPSTASAVTLISDLKEYYRFIEINILQCRNGGIDCRIHGLNIVGRQRSDSDDFVRTFSFLASDGEEQDDLEDFAGDVPLVSSVPSQVSLSEIKSRRSSNSGDTTSASPSMITASQESLRRGPSISRKEGQASIRVSVWGLNDKDQLGGLKGSKIKTPLFSETLSALKPVHICGGSKSLFIISQDGRVYGCGEGTNGRLGLGHSNNVSVPQQLSALSPYVVKKVAVHSGGKHAMALTTDGKVFSWGEGEDGKLGHGNMVTYERPKLVEALKSKRIREIACGSSHSAAITSGGELYTWGMGEYGRLGHGDNSSHVLPKMVESLAGKRVLQVACGSRDAQTLCLTDEGMVYSWGDGDFGKLGRGGSEGCAVPQNIEKLNGLGVTQIECGAQFSLALTKYGQVWTWGKGDYFRLGHNDDRHVRKPTLVEALKGKKIVHVAVGALHCLAVTEAGQVFGWGDNDHGQQGNGSTVVNRKPTLVQGLENVKVRKVACGSSHSVAWTSPEMMYVKGNDTVMFKVPRDPLGIHSLGYSISQSASTCPVDDHQHNYPSTMNQGRQATLDTEDPPSTGSRYDGAGGGGGASSVVEILAPTYDYDADARFLNIAMSFGAVERDPSSLLPIQSNTLQQDTSTFYLQEQEPYLGTPQTRSVDNNRPAVVEPYSVPREEAPSHLPPQMDQQQSLQGTTTDKTTRPSLSKILVSLESTSAQQQALQHILNALQIMLAREIIVAALLPPHSPSLSLTNNLHNADADKVSTSDLQKLPPDVSTRCDSLGTSPSLTSLLLSLEGSVAKDVDVMAQGGGEAPAEGSLEILVSTLFQ